MFIIMKMQKFRKKTTTHFIPADRQDFAVLQGCSVEYRQKCTIWHFQAMEFVPGEKLTELWKTPTDIQVKQIQLLPWFEL